MPVASIGGLITVKPVNKAISEQSSVFKGKFNVSLSRQISEAQLF